MQPLVDAIAEFLEKRCGCMEHDYSVVVHGPPELRLVVTER